VLCSGRVDLVVLQADPLSMAQMAGYSCRSPTNYRLLNFEEEKTQEVLFSFDAGQLWKKE
jgi:hypothetical protein